MLRLAYMSWQMEGMAGRQRIPGVLKNQKIPSNTRASFTEHLIAVMGLCEWLTAFFCSVMSMLGVHIHKNNTYVHTTWTHTGISCWPAEAKKKQRKKHPTSKQTQQQQTKQSAFTLESRNTWWLYHSKFSPKERDAYGGRDGSNKCRISCLYTPEHPPPPKDFSTILCITDS